MNALEIASRGVDMQIFSVCPIALMVESSMERTTRVQCHCSIQCLKLLSDTLLNKAISHMVITKGLLLRAFVYRVWFIVLYEECLWLSVVRYLLVLSGQQVSNLDVLSWEFYPSLLQINRRQNVVLLQVTGFLFCNSLKCWFSPF